MYISYHEKIKKIITYGLTLMSICDIINLMYNILLYLLYIQRKKEKE